MIKPKILVIDDDYGNYKALQKDLLAKIDPSGRCEFTFCSGQTDGRNDLVSVLEIVEGGWPPESSGCNQYWALVLLDVQFVQRRPSQEDGGWGFNILRALRERWPDLPIVMLTSEERAKRGQANWELADGFLAKPGATDSGADQAFLKRLYSFGFFPDVRAGSHLAGKSLALLRVLQEARRFACDPLGSGRIIYGETGTGKTELARFIHDEMRLVAGRSGSFRTWSAAGTDETIAQDALFGHWKNAHSRALRSEPGEIEKAEGGTFFLDEVASLPLPTQGLFMESRRRNAQLRRLVSRMGTFPRNKNDVSEAIASLIAGSQLQKDDHRIAVDVVMLTATNVNLHDDEVAKSLGFRRDLLNDLGSAICLPGLNDRTSDIPEIFGQIVSQIVVHLGGTPKHIDNRVFLELKGRDWSQKNIVALREIAEYAVLAARDFDEILVRHLPTAAGNRKPSSSQQLKRKDAPPSFDVASPARLPSVSSVSDLSKVLANFEIPEELSKLEGSLPLLQDAYARLIVRLLGAALRATRDRRGDTSSLTAVCKLLGVSNLKTKPESYAAYDIVLRLMSLCDVRFEGLSIENNPLYSEFVSNEPEVRERVDQAVQQRRTRTKRTKR